MDELLDRLIQFMEEVAQNFDSLTEEEADEISEFLIETFTQLQNQQRAPNPTPPPVPMGADLLWILSGNNPQAFVNYLRTYPGEGFQELARNPAQLASVIERLEQTHPGGEPGVAPDGIPNTELSSSNVAGMKYDPRSGKLLVKFHGVNKEPVYQYEGVPPQIFQILQHGNAFAQTKGKNRWGEWWPLKNPSIGASVNQYLKAGGYPYRRLS
jgi:hypothetical protein